MLGGSTLGATMLGGINLLAPPLVPGYIKFVVGGVLWSGVYMDGSLEIEEELGARSVCSFRVKDRNTLALSLGAPITVRDRNNVLVFAGTIEEYQEEWPAMDRTTPNRFVTVTAVDYAQIADRRRVAADFVDQLPGDIATTLLTDYLAPEGITAGTIEPGLFTIDRVIFSYQTVAQALDELAELVGFLWRINYDRTLDFLAVESCPLLSFGYSDSSLPVLSLTKRRNRDQYRNRQYLRAGQDILDPPIVETFSGDGETRTFSVQLGIAVPPTVESNRGAGYVTEIVAIRDKDDAGTAQWTWQKDSTQVTQETSESVLGDTHSVRITYAGFVPILVQDDNQTEISARIAIEGGTGLYENLEEDGLIESVDFAIDSAGSMLRKFGKLDPVVELETDEVQARAPVGCLQSVELTREGLTGLFLVTAATAWDRGDGRIRYKYSLAKGEPFSQWLDYHRRLAEQGHTFVVRENEVLVVVRENVEAYELTHVGTGVSGDSLQAWTTDGFSALVVGLSEVGGEWMTTSGVGFNTGPFIAEPFVS